MTTTEYNGKSSQDEHYDLYFKMMNKSGPLPCGCPVGNMWYDDDLGIFRCRNCGWCN